MDSRSASELLRTPRLVGTRVSASDLDDLASLYGDPRVMATLSTDGRVWARARVAEVLERHLEHWRERGFGMWIFRDRPARSLVARAGLQWRELGGRGVAELYYAVTADRWGEGVATEVARCIVEVGFSELALEELVAFCLATNEASARVLDKCGFCREGEVDHAGLPHLLFRLIRSNRPVRPL